MSQHKTAAIYFKSLKLNNVRCFKDEFLDLADENGKLAQWTLLLGDNGLGKTTLLQCLCWMRPVLKETNQKVIPLSSIKEGLIASALTSESNDMLVELRRLGKNSKLKLVGELWQGVELNSSKFTKQGNLKRKEITTEITLFYNENGSLKDDPKEKVTNIKKELGELWEPLIVAYGANRWMGHQNINENELEDPLAAHLSAEGTQLYDVEQRLKTLKAAADAKRLERLEKSEKLDPSDPKKNIEGKESKEELLLKTFKQVLVRVLPKGSVKSEKDIVIEAPRYINGEIDEGKVRLRILDKLVPFAGLSLGYQITSAWILDLTWRLFSKYEKSTVPLEESAIVLIDEIDLHLHPRWQIEIMWELAKIFKRTQFIATAHSPLMVQSMPNANFAVIQKVAENEVKIENEPDKVQGWRLDQILNSQYFDINFSNSPEATKLFKNRNTLLLKSKRTASEEKHLEEIENQILAVGETIVWEDREAIELLREAVTLAKKYENKK